MDTKQQHVPLSYFISSLSTFRQVLLGSCQTNKQTKAYYLFFFFFSFYSLNKTCCVWRTNSACLLKPQEIPGQTGWLFFFAPQFFFLPAFLVSFEKHNHQHHNWTCDFVRFPVVRPFFVAISRPANLCEERCVCVPAAIRWNQPPLTSCFRSISIMARQPQSAALLLLGTVYGTYAHDICRYSL